MTIPSLTFEALENAFATVGDPKSFYDLSHGLLKHRRTLSISTDEKARTICLNFKNETNDIKDIFDEYMTDLDPKNFKKKLVTRVCEVLKDFRITFTYPRQEKGSDHLQTIIIASKKRKAPEELVDDTPTKKAKNLKEEPAPASSSDKAEALPSQAKEDAK